MAAIVEMFTECSRSPPVPTMSIVGPGHLDAVRVLEHDVGEAAQLLDRLALGAQAHEEAGELHRAGLAGHDLGHRPAGLLGGEVLPAQQRGEEVRPGVTGR